MRDARRITVFTAIVAAAALATGVGRAAKAPNARALVRKNCGGCHTMKAAGIYGKFGPSLDTTKPSKALVAKRIRKGATGMPAFPNFSKAQVNAIATYVAAKT